PQINKIIFFSRGDFKDLSRQSKARAIKLLLKTWGEILHYKFDLCIDLSLEHRYSLFLKLLGLRQRIGFNYKNRGRFLTQKINLDGYESKHVVEYHLELLEFLGIKPRFRNLELFLKQEEKAWAVRLLEKNGVLKDDLIIGIIPGGGASWGVQSYLKHWPGERYAQVADRLVQKFGAKIIVFADSSERDIAEDVIKKMQQPAINMIAGTDLRQFMALIDQCNLIITNDGGPLHIAVALGNTSKSVSIFGPVDERVYGPYPPNANNIVLKKDFECRPCYQHFRVPECRYQRRCLMAITAEQVLQESEKALN
ncbi:MAG: glycosyltransferase family 9 protein, partial [Candidatus Atribacteria bacterium]|nr:glycosyltransferase family 9 protein [Candidatus Atribacteria bacterium]